LKSLWIPAHCNRERFADAFDFLVPVPRELTPRQAYLILRFTFDCNRYDRAELEQLHALLGGPTYEGIERWLDLAERR
jgi:hypothetical protein